MDAWQYRITVHTVGDILAKSHIPPSASSPQVLYCEADGTCFFDQTPNPYVEAIAELLDELGQDGWILVQVLPRQADMICFWRRLLRKGENA